MPPLIMAAFDRGQRPTIACIEKSSRGVGVDFEKLVDALQKYIDDAFAPVWGTPAKLVVAKNFVKGAWALVFLDTADVKNALGYHHLTPDGLPLGKVFIETTRSAGASVSVTASHELAEMLVDPAINLSAMGPRGVFYAYETADAVEGEEFEVNGIAMSDFVYPAWFEGFRKEGSTQFDHLKRVKRPFEILRGGYMPVYRDGKWTQIFGSQARRSIYQKQDRRGRRMRG